jgi:hypothetical protein
MNSRLRYISMIGGALVRTSKRAGLEEAFTRRCQVLSGGENKLLFCHSNSCFFRVGRRAKLQWSPQPSTT